MEITNYTSQDMSSFSLWWDDFEEAGIENCIVASSNGLPIGFQAINIDGKTISIEVLDERRGEGVALALIEYSGSIKPERNENPDFWARIQELAA